MHAGIAVRRWIELAGELMSHMGVRVVTMTTAAAACSLLLLQLCGCVAVAAALPMKGGGGGGGEGAYLRYKDPKQPLNTRIDDLLRRMTLAEKIGQMSQIERENATADVVNKYLIGMCIYATMRVCMYVYIYVRIRASCHS